MTASELELHDGPSFHVLPDGRSCHVDGIGQRGLRFIHEPGDLVSVPPAPAVRVEPQGGAGGGATQPAHEIASRRRIPVLTATLRPLSRFASADRPRPVSR